MAEVFEMGFQKPQFKCKQMTQLYKKLGTPFLYQVYIDIGTSQQQKIK
jgi:hypothetical protein